LLFIVLLRLLDTESEGITILQNSENHSCNNTPSICRRL